MYSIVKINSFFFSYHYNIHLNDLSVGHIHNRPLVFWWVVLFFFSLWHALILWKTSRTMKFVSGIVYDKAKENILLQSLHSYCHKELFHLCSSTILSLCRSITYKDWHLNEVLCLVWFPLIGTLIGLKIKSNEHPRK